MSIKYRQEEMVYKNAELPLILNNSVAKGVSKYIPDEMTVHWHEDIEILYYKTSGGYVWIDGEIIEPKAGDIIVINPYEMHNLLWGNAHFEYFYCILSSEFLGDSNIGVPSDYKTRLLSRQLAFKNLVGNSIEIGEMLQLIEKEWKSKHKGYELVVKGLVYGVLGKLIRDYSVEDKAEMQTQGYVEYSERIKKIFKYVEKNHQKNITLAQLADEYGTCEAYFCRQFKKTTHMTPFEFVTNYRIFKAKKLLKTVDLSVSQIASDVGFGDSNSFCKVFKKKTGLTPSEYRANSK